MKTVFIRAIESSDKERILLDAIHQPHASMGRSRFEADVDSFAAVPGTPFAYWVGRDIRNLFREMTPFEGNGRTAKQGLATADDFRFVRLWTEVPPENIGLRWVPFAKGGRFSPYYLDIHLVVNWTGNGSELKAFEPAVIRNPEFYLRAGLTWTNATTLEFSARALPKNCIFGHMGPSAFVPDGERLAILAVLNSWPFRRLLSLGLGLAGQGRKHYEVGLVQRTPVPRLDSVITKSLSSLALHAWSLQRRLDLSAETSHAFVLPSLLLVEGASLSARAITWTESVREVQGALEEVQSRIDEYCFNLYGLSKEDRDRTQLGFGNVALDEKRGVVVEDDDTPELDAVVSVEANQQVADLISWCVGVAFGRFDKERVLQPMPQEPDPFDPLPQFSPGMRSVGRADDGNNAGEVFPAILVDDPGSPNDLLEHVLNVLQYLIDSTDLSPEAIEEAATILDPRDGNLRKWLAHEFFSYHIKKYSMSRRKAPIYWQLATPSRRYSVWLYYHALNKNTMYTVLTDFVLPKLEHEERRLAEMIEEAGDNPTAEQRRQIAEQEEFVSELRAFRDEVARVAPLWNPNLDDGVAINFAPLWRLVPHERSWQRECKTHWDKLVRGDYDWSHWAMHLWPERVIPKCAKDLSLAIAHGLDDVLWVESADGKRVPRQDVETVVARLIRERTSPAVKEALRSY